jgi:YHS domain-containing protein
MKTMRAVLFSTLFLASSVQALEPINTSRGLALRGYDPVAYFTEGKPRKGRAEFETSWMDVTWRFTSSESMKAFVSNPSKYAPQYGGYCAWAVSRNYTADADPEAWRIVGGKLYLNYNAKVQKEWQKDTAGNITRGDRNWPELLQK